MREAAFAAGALALEYKRKGGARAWEKKPGDPVTEADLAVNALLSEKLRKARPDYGWVSEETVSDGGASKADRVWLVDPIDGTRAYMRENDPHWCVGLALIEDGEALAGVIYAPEHDALYETRKGGGAYRNGEPVSASACSADTGCRLIAAEQMVRHKDWREPWPADITLPNPRPNATLLRLALVAEGAWDGVVVLARKSDWDIAAGALLVSEAGGLATTHTGAPFRYNGPVKAQQSLVAAGKALHPLLVRRTKVVPLPDPAEAARR